MKARSGVLTSNVGGNALAPLFSTGSLTTANLITDVTRLAGVEGDGAAYPDSSVGVWTAATNYVTNGGGETNATGWSAAGTGGSTTARITTRAKFGSASISIGGDGAAGRQGAQWGNTAAGTAAVGQTWTASCWVYADQLVNMAVSLSERDAAAGFLAEHFGSDTPCAAGQWTKVSLTYTLDQATCSRLSVKIVTSGTAHGSAWTASFDGYNLTQTAIDVPYIETDGGTASRSVGTIDFPSSLLSASAGTLAFRWKAGCAYTTTYRPRFMHWLSGNNYYALYYNPLTDQFWFLRDNGSGSGDIVKSASQTFALGDTLTIQVRWSPTEIGIKVNTAAWVTLASTKVPSGLPATVSLGSSAERPIGSLYWVWAGKAAISDSESIQVAAQGNNDPLPHMLPKDASPSLLAHFNGDGKFYRRIN